MPTKTDPQLKLMNTLAGMIGKGASVEALLERLHKEGVTDEREAVTFLCKVVNTTLQENTQNFRTQLVKLL